MLGSTIGKGRGRLVATATGALVGSMFGNHLAQPQPGYVARPAPRPVYHHRRQNHRNAHRHHRRDVDTPIGHAIPATTIRGWSTCAQWRRPVTDTVQITTIYDAASGRYCREYQREVIINGQPVAAYGRACQQPDGSWQIVDAERQTY